jgi:hypothetical protein
MQLMGAKPFKIICVQLMICTSIQGCRVYDDRTFITSSINSRLSTVIRDGSFVSHAVQVLVTQGTRIHASESTKRMSARNTLRDRAA